MAKQRSSDDDKKANRYSGILAHIFGTHYKPGKSEFTFDRAEIEAAAKALKIELPKNLGDVIYSFRYRTALPVAIGGTAEIGFEWVIEPAGRSRYRMVQRKWNRIIPNPTHLRIKIPDATPQIVAKYAQGDEQALLAKVRYNRLIDVFLRVAAYSLQNHLRTHVPDVGQIETDEVYVAVDNAGRQFVVPVQAKGGADKIGGIQVAQDLALCRKTFPQLTPRPVAVQFVRDAADEVIVMFELAEADGEIRVVDEKHYRLAPAAEITPDDLRLAQNR
ncbi:MAG: hypothetical protein K2P78_12095 [Gemmataceae bacterium]|nr:hypothetical protein [Gemmataceae bacterium]